MAEPPTTGPHTVATGPARAGAATAAPDRGLDAGLDAGHGGGPDGVASAGWDRSGRVATWALATAWAVAGALAMARPVFISHDSLSNNAHVWWIAEQLWHGHGVPLRMPVLGAGRALTFPYASLPWATAALAWPLLGDRAVTLWLVAGFAATVAATFWAFPTLRRGWWAAATLANPFLVISPLLGQLPFLWAIAACTAAVGCWRRGRTAAAVALVAVAQVVHPAVMLPVVGVLVLGWLPFERRERRTALLGGWLAATVVSVPAVWAVFQSPVVSQSSTAEELVALVQTVAARILVLLIPIAMVLLQRWAPVRRRAWVPAVLTAVFLLAQLPMYRPFGMDFAWGALWRSPQSEVEAFARRYVDGGRVHRVLTGTDGKYGLYAVLRAGAVLDAEFFPEGLHRGPFRDGGAYARFLRDRRVERVVWFPSYDARFRHSNEHRLLGDLDGRGCVGGVTVRRRPTAGPGELYVVDRC